MPHAQAAVADVGAAAGLPDVVPKLAAGAGIDGPSVLGRRDVEHPFHLENRAFEADVEAQHGHAQQAADDQTARPPGVKDIQLVGFAVRLERCGERIDDGFHQAPADAGDERAGP
jgi:hypothetical protein